MRKAEGLKFDRSFLLDVADKVQKFVNNTVNSEEHQPVHVTMDDSNEWELSKENVQPLRQGRKVASLTSALQHTPADLQQIKEQREYGDLFPNLRLTQ